MELPSRSIVTESDIFSTCQSKDSSDFSIRFGTRGINSLSSAIIMVSVVLKKDVAVDID